MGGNREVRTRVKSTKAAKDVTSKGKDRLKAIRKATSTTKDTHTVNGEMDWCLLRNDGANDIKINFKTDNMASNYWTLKAGESLPSPVGVAKDTEIHYESVSGTPDLEIILWA